MGGGTTQSQSSTQLPAWLQPYASAALSSYTGQVAPGSPLAAGAQTLAPYNPAMNQQVAPFTPGQQTGIDYLQGAAAPASAQLAEANAQQIGQTLQGQYLNSNPYLDATYGAAARGLSNQYMTSTAPGLAVQGQQAGVSGGIADRENQALGRYQFGNQLQDLAANIYGGNYQQERARQLQASQLTPGAQSALVQPGATELATGTLQQSQQQAGLDATSRNATAQAQFPFQQLSGWLNAIAQAGGGTGQAFAQPPGGSGKSGLQSGIGAAGAIAPIAAMLLA